VPEINQKSGFSSQASAQSIGQNQRAFGVGIADFP